VFALLTGTIVAVLFAAIATAGGVKLADHAPSLPWDLTLDSPVTTIAPVAPVEPVAANLAVSESWHLPQVVEVILRVVFYGCVGVVVALVVVYAWRHRPRLHWRRGRRPPSVHFEVLDDVVAAISSDADAQRAALQHGSPRNAIVECWLRLEAAVVAAGVRRDPADTSAELTQRVLATHHVDPIAIASLAALYREARFSDHSIGEDARRAAIDALDTVHDGLSAGLSTEVATA
jgi:hypothetical protein